MSPRYDPDASARKAAALAVWLGKQKEMIQKERKMKDEEGKKEEEEERKKE